MHPHPHGHFVPTPDDCRFARLACVLLEYEVGQIRKVNNGPNFRNQQQPAARRRRRTTNSKWNEHKNEWNVFFGEKWKSVRRARCSLIRKPRRRKKNPFLIRKKWRNQMPTSPPSREPPISSRDFFHGKKCAKSVCGQARPSVAMNGCTIHPEQDDQIGMREIIRNKYVWIVNVIHYRKTCE